MKNIGTIRSTKDILMQQNFRIKKHFGQNFLVDPNILEKIADQAGLSPRTDVIEIGPGFGALTEILLPRSRRLLAYEIDKELIPILNGQLGKRDNFILQNQDVLDIDIDRDIEKYLPDAEEVIVVANLPYYITTPILMRFLETSRRVTRMIVMMQAEVADRVTSRPDTKDYNALSIVINYRAQTRILFQVPRTVFIPPPNVDSTVVEVRVRTEIAEKPADESRFFTLVHQCFAQRRKTLLNNLRQALPGLSRAEIEQLLAECDIPLDIRAEALDIPDFIRLSNGVTART